MVERETFRLHVRFLRPYQKFHYLGTIQNFLFDLENGTIVPHLACSRHCKTIFHREGASEGPGFNVALAKSKMLDDIARLRLPTLLKPYVLESE
jgi:hypothetical protein